MNWKTTWLLLVLAAALFAFIYLVERHTRPTSATAAPPPRLLSLQANAVTNISLRRTNQLILRAERAGASWNLTAPLFYPAQTFAIENLLQTLEDLTSAAYIPIEELKTRRRSIADYGLDVPLATLTLQHNGQRTEVFLGFKSPVGDHVYAQLLNGSGVHIVTADVFDRLPRGANDWRDNLLINFNGLGIDRIEVRAPTRGFALGINPTNRLFYLVKPTPARADNAKVDALLRKIAAARVTQFVSDDPRVDLDVFGLQPPETELAFGLGSNDLVSVQFGKSPTNDSSLVFARRSSQTNIVLVPRTVLESLQTSYTELRDRRLLTFAPDSVSEIAVVGAENYAVRRGTNGVWMINDSQESTADSELVKEWLDRLDRLEGTVEKDVVTDFTSYGLAPPTWQYILRSGGVNPAGPPTNQVLAQLDIGARVGEKIFTRRPDENSVYAIPPVLYDGLPSAAWQLRDRHVWSFSTNQVTRISIRHRGYTRQMVRSADGEALKLAPGSEGVINYWAVEDTLYKLGDLRAAVWVARGDQDRGRYGFNDDGHKITIELKNGDKPRVLTLEFGAKAPSQFPYALATVDGQSWIFEFPLHLYFFVVRDLSNPPLRAAASETP